MRAICLCLLAIMASMAGAQAYIALQMSYYNSEDSMDMSMEGVNLEFDSYCQLAPDSILYNNGGTSDDPDTSYSYSLSLNEETLYSSAETDSGKLACHGNIVAGEDKELISVTSSSAVIDGNLSLAYGNDDFKVEETVQADGSAYKQKASITPDSVTSSGSGSTLYPVAGLAENLQARKDASTRSQNSDKADQKTDSKKAAAAASSSDSSADSNEEEVETDDDSIDLSGDGDAQGIRHYVSVKDMVTGKQGSIDTDVMGSTEAQWSTEVKYDPDSYSFGINVRGIGLAPITELGMTGQASDFPTRTLPPGKVDFNYTERPETDPVPGENYSQLLKSEFSEFKAMYPQATPALLYYNLYNEFHTDAPTGGYDPTESLPPLEKYYLRMGFNVKNGSS